MPFGVMGGDYQPVGHAHVLSAILDHGLDPQEAIDAPRVMSYPVDLWSSAACPRRARADLAARGHALIEPEGPLGGGQAIAVDRGEVC